MKEGKLCNVADRWCLSCLKVSGHYRLYLRWLYPGITATLPLRRKVLQATEPYNLFSIASSFDSTSSPLSATPHDKCVKEKTKN